MSIANGSMGSGISMYMGSGNIVCMGSGSSMCMGSGNSVCMGSGRNVCMGSGSSVCMGTGTSVCMGSGSSVCMGSGKSVCMGSGQKGHKHLAQGIALGKKPATNIALKGQKPYNAIPAFALTGRSHSTLAKTQGDALGYGHIGLTGHKVDNTDI